MGKGKGDTPVNAVRIPRRKKRKRPDRPPAELPEPLVSYEF